LADPTGDLTDILKYHVVNSDVRAGDLSNGLQTASLEGTNITIQLEGNDAYVNNVMISVTDLVAGNGVVHVIDAVILPSTATVVDIIVNSDDHETLEDAVLAAGLETALSGSGEFTVFAPTDAAFAALGQAKLDELLADPTGDLTDILKYHVVNSDVRAGDLSDGLTAATLQGSNITIKVDNSGNYVDDVKISVTDLVAGNGVVHVIDAVLIPKAGVTGLNEVDNDLFTIYPNPTSNSFSILSDQNISSIKVYSLAGELMFSQDQINDNVDISSLEKGIYFVHTIIDGVESNQRLVVQ
jgi:uncharacterized surface protein with fasciclin (FAS1) repeats